MEKSEKQFNAKESGKETITASALKYNDEIFVGQTHADAWNLMTSKYPESVLSNVRGDGFITSTGRFVERAEALEIAENAQQIDKGVHKTLFSENIIDQDKEWGSESPKK